MGFQTGRNIAVSFAPETTYGEPALPGAAAKNFRPNSGALSLTKEPIRSGENRRDGQMTRGRHGSRSVGGSYVGDLSLGTYDDLLAAIFRGSFDPGLNIAGLGLTADPAAKTITRAAGSWLADGIRVGDVIRAGGFTTAANNGKNLRVTSVTATVLGVDYVPAAVGAAENGVSIIRPKKLLMGTMPRSLTIEEAELDIDASEVFTGCRVGQFALRLAPNGMATVTFTVVGQDMDLEEGAASPYFTNVISTSSLGMTAVEAKLRLGDMDVLDLTALDLSVNLGAAGQPVVGSNVTPDVFTNLANVEGSATALRKDVSRVKQFLNEDQLSLHVMFTENESEPRDFCSFFVGNMTLSSATKSELGADGPRTQQLAFLIGSDDRGGAFAPGALTYQTSAAA